MINPPTDNLYKFCSIVGIILVLFNSYYGFEMLMESGNELTKLIGEQKKHSLKLSINENKTKELLQTLKSFVIEKEKFLKEKETIIQLMEQNKLKKEQLEILNNEFILALKNYELESKKIGSINMIRTQEYEALQFERIEINTKYALIKRQELRIEIYSKYMWSGIILGAILSFYGFINWAKIQKAIDREQLK